MAIAEDGEILVKGENVMLGYWNNDLETQKVLKMDGYILAILGFLKMVI